MALRMPLRTNVARLWSCQYQHHHTRRLTPLLHKRLASSTTLNEASQLTESEKSTINTESDELEITTGMIGKDSNESLLYFDNFYPKLAQFEQISWVVTRVLGLNIQDNVAKIFSDRTIPKDLPVTVSKVIPREKDGGVFVKFAIDQDAELDRAKVQETLIDTYTNNPYRPWFKLPNKHVRVFPVRGTPWIEDLKRSQSSELKVTFDGEDLGQQSLYSILRRYGPIVDIVPPSPGDAVPRSAVVSFSRQSDAATARNCATGISLRHGKTKLHISFIPVDKKGMIKNWIMEHPRIVIPVLVALLATLAVIIFEPIRVWFIKYRISGQLVGLEKYPTLNWFKLRLVGMWKRLFSQVRGSFSGFWNTAESTGAFDNLWDERRNAIDTLSQWIGEGVNTFVVVHGPKGSGKQNLVFNQSLGSRENILTVDLATLSKANSSDSGFIKTASSVLGYYPVFSWMNSITQFMDLAVQGLTGQKTGFAESVETQFKNMLTTAGTAVSQVALMKKPKDSDASDDSYLQLHPENKPVIVINNLVSKSGNESDAFVYKHVVDWAGSLIQANVAHVIVVTDDVGYENMLNDALPNQVFKTLPVGDASAESAKAFVKQQFESKAQPDAEEDFSGGNEKQEMPQVSFEGLDEALRPLGGRMTDLQAFSRRLKSGETPQEALEDMIEQAKIEVLQMYVMKPGDGWTKEQAWSLIKMLAAAGNNSKQSRKKSSGLFGTHKETTTSVPAAETPTAELPMEDLTNDSNFSSPDAQQALSELEHMEMISLHTEGGRILSVKAGKPLYQGAFEALVKDRNLNAWMESSLIEKLISGETASISGYEKELAMLAQMPNKSEIRTRVDYLAKKMYDGQKRIEDYEKKYSEQQKILGK